ncbi:MAG: VWA domain-containing protein [Bacteroidetes bacterium]|nr:VWA domain-containing protein [Bacteroidota bacterium]
MFDYTFKNPEFLWLLLGLIPLVAGYVLYQAKWQASLRLSSLNSLKGMPSSWKYYFRHLPFLLRILAISLIIFAIARPQTSENWTDKDIEGIDIVICTDISGSMRARDFRPNRLEAAKEVAQQFIDSRPNDRISIVIFSAESFTQCPLTSDHKVVSNLLKDIRSGMLEDGTAVGLGLATSVARLKDSDAKSKVVILLTDGVNNMGEVSPKTAGEIAREFGIRAYTVGVGTRGQAPMPVQTRMGEEYRMMDVEIDEEMLTEIAQMTGGKYFRATNKETLENIYQEIDQLEKTRISVIEFSEKEDEYLPFVLLAGLLFLLEILFRYTLFRTVP